MADTMSAPKGVASAQPVKTGGAGAKSAQPPITKLEAVRQALAKLGNDALPSQMQPYIKKTFGIDMTTDHISTSKGDIARKAREAAEAAHQAAGKKPAAPKTQAAPKAQATTASSTPAPTGTQTPSAHGKGSVGGNILLEDVLTTKELLDRVGAEKLRTLIDGLAK